MNIVTVTLSDLIDDQVHSDEIDTILTEYPMFVEVVPHFDTLEEFEEYLDTVFKV